MSRPALLFTGLLAAFPAAAAASETISYTYDVHGRLTNVVRAGAVNNGITTTYAHDKVNNRSSVVTTGAAAAGTLSIQAADDEAPALLEIAPDAVPEPSRAEEPALDPVAEEPAPDPVADDPGIAAPEPDPVAEAAAPQDATVDLTVNGSEATEGPESEADPVAGDTEPASTEPTPE